MSADLREKLGASEEELTALAHHCRKFARGRNEPDDEDPRDLFGTIADVLDRYRAEITDLLTSHEEREGEDYLHAFLEGAHEYRGDNTIDAGDDPAGSEGGYDRHGNRIIPGAMREIVALRNLVDDLARRLRSHTDREPDGWIYEWRFGEGVSSDRSWTRHETLYPALKDARRSAVPRGSYETRIRPVYIGPPVQPGPRRVRPHTPGTATPPPYPPVRQEEEEDAD